MNIEDSERAGQWKSLQRGRKKIRQREPHGVVDGDIIYVCAYGKVVIPRHSQLSWDVLAFLTRIGNFERKDSAICDAANF